MRKRRVSESTEGLDEAVQQAVRVEPELIEAEFARLPGDIAYQNARYARALRKYLLAKHARDKVWSKLYIQIRERSPDDGAARGRMTEKHIEALIESEDEYEEAKLACIEAQADVEMLSGVVDALRAKKDALVSIGAHMRVEKEIQRSGRDFKAAHDIEATRSVRDEDEE
jgi:hypothetical protein